MAAKAGQQAVSLAADLAAKAGQPAVSLVAELVRRPRGHLMSAAAMISYHLFEAFAGLKASEKNRAFKMQKSKNKR